MKIVHLWAKDTNTVIMIELVGKYQRIKGGSITKALSQIGGGGVIGIQKQGKCGVSGARGHIKMLTITTVKIGLNILLEHNVGYIMCNSRTAIKIFPARIPMHRR